MTIKSGTGLLSNIAIVGAGNMGSSIAVSLSQTGLPVKLIDCSASALASGLTRIEKIWSSLELKAQKNQNNKMLANIKSGRSLICPIESYAELHDADLIIEAVSEDIEIKKTIFQTPSTIAYFFNRYAARQRVGVAAIGAERKIARLHGGGKAGGNRLLAERKMARALDQVLQE